MTRIRRRIHLQLAQLVAEGIDSARIADAAEKHWHALHAALSPIIGGQGVAALYKRSLHLNRASYAWLVEVPAAAEASSNIFNDMRWLLARQTSEDAAAAHGALLQTFNDLLTSLIGISLTERLLGSVWDELSPGHDAEDSNP